MCLDINKYDVYKLNMLFMSSKQLVSIKHSILPVTIANTFCSETKRYDTFSVQLPYLFRT